MPYSLNKGISISSGKYIVRVDADDYVNSNYLNILSIFLDLNDYMNAIACDYLLVDENEKIIERKSSESEPIGCGIMFRKEVLEEIGYYDVSMKYHEDKDLYERFTEKHKIHRLQLPLYRYRKHDANMTNNVKEMEKYSKILAKKYT